MSLFSAKEYLNYRLKAKNQHSIHPPFLFSLYTDVIKNSSAFYAFEPLILLRKKLEQNKSSLDIEDFGAGSKTLHSTKRTIRSIALRSSIKRKYGELLFRLVNHYKPSNIIELGSCLGLSTCYLAMASSQSNIHSFEGSASLINYADKSLKALSISNVELINGKFDDELPKLLKKLKSIDFAFIDGNHKRAPTLMYFELIAQKANNQTIIVFDDIYWSKEMKMAWQEIKLDKRLSLTIDLFQFGIVFFNKSLSKEDFVLKY